MTTSIIAVANQKGGVGKTTTTVNVATSLAAIGKKVLVIDLDPQGNTTTGFGYFEKDRIHGCYEVLSGQAAIEDVLLSTPIPNLTLLAGKNDLAGVDQELLKGGSLQSRLKEKLRECRQKFDFVIIDCPPSIGVLTVNALCAATHVLIPLQCEYYALEGLSQLLFSIRRLKQNFNKDLEVLGIVLTMYDKRSALADQVVKDVKKHFPSLVFNSIIPRNVKVSESPSHGLPAVIYDVRCSGAVAHMHLASEVLDRVKNREIKNAA